MLLHLSTFFSMERLLPPQRWGQRQQGVLFLWEALKSETSMFRISTSLGQKRVRCDCIRTCFCVCKFYLDEPSGLQYSKQCTQFWPQSEEVFANPWSDQDSPSWEINPWLSISLFASNFLLKFTSTKVSTDFSIKGLSSECCVKPMCSDIVNL